MIDNYEAIRKLARDLVDQAELPGFYAQHADECRLSTHFFQTNPVIVQLTDVVTRQIENDFGHGLHHSVKVAIDAGALILIECKKNNCTAEKTERLLLLVQCAGLLHDIKRKEKNHAIKSADYSSGILKDYPFSTDEIDGICLAIRNHEAFKDITGDFTLESRLLANCLYDADKFRWGPDNFAHTVWEMVSFSKIPVPLFLTHFPRGLKLINRIKNTFRSDTGKKFGPEFITIGTAIGNELYQRIKKSA